MSKIHTAASLATAIASMHAAGSEASAADAAHGAECLRIESAFGSALTRLDGASSPAACEQWAKLGAAFKGGYLEARGVAEDDKTPDAGAAKKAANKAWSRFTGPEGLNLTRPQTAEQAAEAAKKATQRAEKKKKEKAILDAANHEGGEDAPPAPAEGADMSGKTIVLRGVEVHLLMLLRSGQVSAAQTLVASWQATPAPEVAPEAPKLTKASKPVVEAPKPEPAPF